MLQATGKAVSRMNKCEIIERLKNIAKHAVHTVGEEPFVMSLDDGIAVHEAIELLKKPEMNCSEIPNNSDTTTHDSNVVKKGGNDEDRTTDDLISRQALCEYALNQKDKSVSPNDIMRFPSAQPFHNITMNDVLEYIDRMPEDVWQEFTACLECRGWELQRRTAKWCGGDFA